MLVIAAILSSCNIDDEIAVNLDNEYYRAATPSSEVKWSKIYEYTPGFVHSKLFISDDKIATVGTVNMDYRSFFFHFECGVWLSDKKTALDIKHHFSV